MNKSYPQFNLTTLQLPAPASNMTLAEYKEAYGIDLEEPHNKAFKLVLFGNEKYPIDQIKEVEGGYEVYFNGRILSITDIVQTSDEVYDVSNAKPLYYHGLEFFKEGLNIMYCHILNNSPEPINSISKLFAWASTFDTTVVIQTSGRIKLTDENDYRELYSLNKRVDNTNFNVIVSNGANGYLSLNNFDLTSYFSVMNDRVNRIL